MAIIVTTVSKGEVQMRYSTSLITSGYELRFYLEQANGSPDRVAIVVVFVGHPDHSVPPIKSIANFMFVHDLEKFSKYLENHIFSIGQNPDYQSHTFLTYGTVFKIKALRGEVHSNSEGVFSIQCMVNVGSPTNQSFSTYLGGEAMLTVKDANRFIEDMRGIVAKLSS